MLSLLFRFTNWNFEAGETLPSEEEPSKDLCAAYGLPWGTGYLPAVAYGQSKTASILHAKELGRRMGAEKVIGLALHPGAIATELWRSMNQEAQKAAFSASPTKTLKQGVATMIVAAFDPNLTSSTGAYLEDCQFAIPALHVSNEIIAETCGILVEGLSTKIPSETP